MDYSNGCVPTINNDYTNADESYCDAYTCTASQPIAWNSLCWAKIANDCSCDGGALSRNGLAEIRAVLGWNFLNDEEEDYHFGIGIYAAAPTGSSVGNAECNGKGDGKGRYLFEPIVGNGHHWELGAQVTGHHIFWRNDDDSKNCGIYLESNISHMFGANQIRCFDLKSAGSSSRYMLAQYLDSNRNSYPSLGNSGLVDSLGLEFGNIYAPVANLTVRNVKSVIAVQADIGITVSYRSNNFQWDLGYDFWATTPEDLSIENCCPNQAIVGNWALKGDQRVYGFTTAIPQLSTTPDVPVKLAVSDQFATINTGSNMAAGFDYTPAIPTQPFNQEADNATLASSTDTHIIYDQPSAIGTSKQIFTSNPPIFITEGNFDLTSIKGLSNKVFTNFNWNWNNNSESKWTPYLGIGGELEWGRTNNDCSTNQCAQKNPCASSSSCCEAYPNNVDLTPCPTLAHRPPTPSNAVKCALSQWGIWVKVGSSYN